MRRAPTRKKGRARAGVKRGDLSRRTLIAVAIEIIDARGAAALSMRALAEAVGVTPMALYNHFSSKVDLLAGVAESILSTANFDGQHANWEKQIRHCFAVLRDLCLRHPGLPGLLEHDGAAPAAAFAPMEVTLRALRARGMNELDSARTFFLLTGFTLSQASYQTRPVPGLEPSEQVRTKRVAGRGYETVEHLELPHRWDFDASFEFGISLVLRGVDASVPKMSAERGKPRSRRPA